MEQFQSSSCQEPGEFPFVYFWGKRSKELHQNKWKERLTDHFNISCWRDWETRSLTQPLMLIFFILILVSWIMRVVGVGDLKLLCFNVSTVLITPLGVNSLSKDTECFINASFWWILSGRLFPSGSTGIWTFLNFPWRWSCVSIDNHFLWASDFPYVRVITVLEILKICVLLVGLFRISACELLWKVLFNLFLKVKRFLFTVLSSFTCLSGQWELGRESHPFFWWCDFISHIPAKA